MAISLTPPKTHVTSVIQSALPAQKIHHTAIPACQATDGATTIAISLVMMDITTPTITPTAHSATSPAYSAPISLPAPPARLMEPIWPICSELVATKPALIHIMGTQTMGLDLTLASAAQPPAKLVQPIPRHANHARMDHSFTTPPVELRVQMGPSPMLL